MIEIIPAIDIIEGKCVRLSQGDYNSKKVYNENPVEVAKEFEAAGIRRLHLVDLDGAKAQHIVNQKILEQVVLQTSLTVDFGGGLKSDDDVRIAFDCGASMITGGSIAVKDEERFVRWLKYYGGERIILGADVRDEMLAVNGWTETTNIELLPFIGKFKRKGLTKVICTDIAKDGMLQGASVDLYRKILNQYPDLYLIASGGVSNIRDIEELEHAGVPAVIFGKAIYEGNIKLSDLKRFL
ncbi:MAG: 1-(5-phosphoribosyl)-5-[(5-phosphoribosylamino)methylideneamino]imidazole-4-carboxamide isomerase [Prevotellaceae bacterium]|jgi:phosphoribosylformimino-5-aminoimidazole carboxamide ribotide isomerase|nr:1-(5-phosphoribosyl)-5-[(5-phosphoribosylamino)methylideneamino]imidazole-4-carboxamide isomerase [Prevotellaceae bacterium]